VTFVLFVKKGRCSVTRQYLRRLQQTMRLHLHVGNRKCWYIDIRAHFIH